MVPRRIACAGRPRGVRIENYYVADEVESRPPLHAGGTSDRCDRSNAVRSKDPVRLFVHIVECELSWSTFRGPPAQRLHDGECTADGHACRGGRRAAPGGVGRWVCTVDVVRLVGGAAADGGRLEPPAALGESTRRTDGEREREGTADNMVG